MFIPVCDRDTEIKNIAIFIHKDILRVMGEIKSFIHSKNVAKLIL